MIETATYDGAPRGSILAVPQHEIPDDGARYIQDGFVHESGLTRRRGIIQPVPFVATFPDAASGIVQSTQPNGISRVAVLHGTTSPKLGVLSEDYLTFSDVPLPGVLSTAPYYIVDAKPSIDSGAWIGISSQVDEGSPNQYLIYWRGADKPDYSTGTVAITGGSTTVTGTGTHFTTTVVPGMFLFDANGMYQGVVKQVVSDTSLTLEAGAYLTVSGVYTLKSIRGFIRKVEKGRITTDATAVVNGAATKFKDQALDSGIWNIFRASDNRWVGQVASVQSNVGLTLAAPATVVMEDEHFFAVKQNEDTSFNAVGASKPGFLSAAYAQLQFFAVGTNLRFSDSSDPEAVDFDPNAGDFIPVASSAPGAKNTPIVGVAPAFNSMLVLKENESFALAGSDPINFELHKLGDDGCFAPMSIQQYNGNVIYAGREGIHLYDGVQTRNMVEDTLGSFYKSLVRNFDPKTHRMWSMVDSDHYMLFIESVESTYKVFKGQSGVAPTRMTIAIHLPNMAVTFLTNVDVRGSITLPASTGRGTWYLVNTASGARISRARDLFEVDGPQDVLTGTGNTAGPDFYFESKRYTLGDSLLKKLWKLLLLNYYAGGDDLKFETLTGLNDEGTVSLNDWLRTILTWSTTPPVEVTWSGLAARFATWDEVAAPRFVAKRRRFTKRHQMFGFRIYQKSSSVTSVKLGSWSIGFKPLRKGRV